jgi:hypothetical protein
MRIAFIEDWRQAWRLFTIIGTSALAIANVIHENSDVLKALFPPPEWTWINVLCLCVIGVGRVVKQQIPAPTAPPPPAAPAQTKDSS